jgi:SAM-dependent methyltransferase
MSRPPRVNYDQIAHLYDSQPYRSREIDPEFLTFLRERPAQAAPAMLDIACGTGNQLISNRAAVPGCIAVGADRSLGMLRQAIAKTREIGWLRADSAALPFAADSFDFVCCQFAFHHFRDKAEMLRETYRVLRLGGRFVLRNLCPEQSENWLYYRYFPEAFVVDLLDFWPTDAIAAVMESAGFAPVEVKFERLQFDVNVAEWLAIVRNRRDTCSQLQAISDEAYAAGVRRLEAAVAGSSEPVVRGDQLCMATVRGEKSGRG